MTSIQKLVQRHFLPFSITLLAVCLFSTTAVAQSADDSASPRIIITTDPELDDINSLIRFLLYSNEMEIEGLVYASSGYHWKGDGEGTKWFVPGREYTSFGLDTCPCESWRWSNDVHHIDDVVDAYEKVFANLKVHDDGYPDPNELRAKIRWGNVEFDGDISEDTPGSDLIKSLILDDKPGQLFVSAWGGHSTIARALKSIEEQFEYTLEWEALKDKIARKVVLLPSGDQDDMYAKYIQPNWPDIEYRTFRGGPNYGYGAQTRASEENAPYLTAEWMAENVLRGPFGELYRVWGDGKQMVEGDIFDYFGLQGYTTDELREMGYAVWLAVQPQGSWLSEGDNPTFMNMLGNGLRAWQDGTYGGWGGRAPEGTETGNADQIPFPNFFPEAQRSFAARLNWSVTEDYAEANHEPVATVQGPLSILASAGQTIRLNGAVSDPDGDDVSLNWWQFRVGSYPGEVIISDPNLPQTEIQIPEDATAGQTIHIILEATDDGAPSLTSYKRVIITVEN